MSQWTHVAGVVRIDALRFIAGVDFEALLGPMCLFDAWDDSSTLPRGSEGSLQYSVWENPDNAMAAYVVTIWGDLRDYDDTDAIESWLRDTFGNLLIRNIAVVIEVEGDQPRVITSLK